MWAERERSGKRSGAGGKWAERERSGERVLKNTLSGSGAESGLNRPLKIRSHQHSVDLVRAISHQFSIDSSSVLSSDNLLQLLRICRQRHHPVADQRKEWLFTFMFLLTNNNAYCMYNFKQEAQLSPRDLAKRKPAKRLLKFDVSRNLADLEISQRSSTTTHLKFLRNLSLEPPEILNLLRTVSDIWDVTMTTSTEMTFTCYTTYTRSSKVAPIERSCMISY